MYGLRSENGYIDMLEGIKIKTLCSGDQMIMNEFLFKKGAVIPEHSHPNEQTGYLVKGKIRLFMDSIYRDLYPGDSWNIKKDIKHKAEILEDSAALEVFSPLREDYLKYKYEKDIIL